MLTLTRWLVACILRSRLNKKTGAVLNRCAKGGLGALDTMLRALLPLAGSAVCAAVSELRLGGCRRGRLGLEAAASNGLHRGAHGRRHSDGIRVVAGAALYSVPRGQEGIEPLDQVRMPREEFRDAVDHSGSVDPIGQSALAPSNQSPPPVTARSHHLGSPSV